MRYKVTARPRFPAHDERDGWSTEVRAASKSDAVKMYRREIRDAGHTGAIYFTAEPIDCGPNGPLCPKCEGAVLMCNCNLDDN
jgi:hypothetical protein